MKVVVDKGVGIREMAGSIACDDTNLENIINLQTSLRLSENENQTFRIRVPPRFLL
jgi:hypothetical protein